MPEEQCYFSYYGDQIALLDQHEAHAYVLREQTLAALAQFGRRQLIELEQSSVSPNRTSALICTAEESALLLKAFQLPDQDTEEVVIRKVKYEVPILSLRRSTHAEEVSGQAAVIVDEPEDGVSISFNYAPHAAVFSSVTQTPLIARLAPLGLPLASAIRSPNLALPFFLLPRHVPEGALPIEQEAKFLDSMLLALMGDDLIARGIKNRPNEPYSLARIRWTEEEKRVFFCIGELPYFPDAANSREDRISPLLSLWVGPQVGVVKRIPDAKEM